MSEVPSASAALNATTPATTTANAAEAAASATSDFNDFLTLLTAQLKNQDPLNPLDATQFVEQLASFSSVEQQVSTNAKLDQLIAGQSANTLNEVAGWVGREVRVIDDQRDFTGSPITFDVPAQPGMATAAVEIRDRFGNLVRTLPAQAAGGEATWDGATDAGETALRGTYTVTYAYQTSSGQGFTLQPEAYIQVQEAQIIGGEARLKLANGSLVSPNEVTGLRDAS